MHHNSSPSNDHFREKFSFRKKVGTPGGRTFSLGIFLLPVRASSPFSLSPRLQLLLCHAEAHHGLLCRPPMSPALLPRSFSLVPSPFPFISCIAPHRVKHLSLSLACSVPGWKRRLGCSVGWILAAEWEKIYWENDTFFSPSLWRSIRLFPCALLWSSSKATVVNDAEALFASSNRKIGIFLLGRGVMVFFYSLLPRWSYFLALI